MQVFIKRPVMALAINLIVVILGFVALKQLPLRHETMIPKYDIKILTFYPGANNKVVAQRITKHLEDALSGLSGIYRIISVNKDSVSEIVVQLEPSKNYEKVISNIRDRVQSKMSWLPIEAEKPVIFEQGENKNNVLYFTLRDNARSKAEIYDYVRRYILNSIKSVSGVAEIEIWGARTLKIVVEIDPLKIAKLNLNVNDILNVLRREKIFATGGDVETAIGQKMIVLEAPLVAASDIGEIALPYKDPSIETNGKGTFASKINPIYKIKDVANVEIKPQKSYINMLVDGEDTLTLAVSAKPNSNPVDVVKSANKKLKEINKNLPKTMKMEAIYDATKSFSSALREINSALIEAIVFVGVIVVLSLGSLRASIIPMVTVPLCIISTFFVIWILDFTINPVTLLALVLAVGLVVDDAIVVVENIHKHIEAGKSPLQAAIYGMKEITFAVVVMTLTLAAVYLPLAFQADETSYILREFAFTLAGSVLLSGFVALTLIPAMSVKFLTGTALVNKKSISERFWFWLNNLYKSSLALSLNHTKKVLLSLLVLAGLAWYGYQHVPQELKPIEDTDIMQGWISYDNQVADNVKQGWYKKIEEIIEKNVPEKEKILLGQWQEYSWFVVTLKPRKERSRGLKEIAQQLETKLKTIAGPSVGVNYNSSSGGEDEQNLGFIVQYAGAKDVLINSCQTIINKIRNQEDVKRVWSKDLEKRSRYKVKILRDMAAELGISVQDVEDTLNAFFTGRKAFDFTFDDYDYDVDVRVMPELQGELNAIDQFFVRTNDGVSVSLGVLVDISEITDTISIRHYDRLPGIKIKIDLKKGVSLEKALEQIEPIVRQYMPENAKILLAGDLEKYKLAKQAMIITFTLALAFIFLVLAALFESFIDPFIVMLTVPLSILGAIWAIYFIGGTNNLYTQIGMVTLIGLITKHGILITDFANRQIQSGKSIKDAVLIAASARLRPILMTTLAMICGAVPLVFSLGAGANARMHLGWVIIGGMVTGTIFSLYIIPVVYKVFARFKEKI